jgi:membrane protein YqaA with SNARE-associated domain
MTEKLTILSGWCEMFAGFFCVYVVIVRLKKGRID